MLQSCSCLRIAYKSTLYHCFSLDTISVLDPYLFRLRFGTGDLSVSLLTSPPCGQNEEMQVSQLNLLVLSMVLNCMVQWESEAARALFLFQSIFFTTACVEAVSGSDSGFCTECAGVS